MIRSMKSLRWRFVLVGIAGLLVIVVAVRMERSARREQLAQEVSELRASGLLPESGTGHRVLLDVGAYYEERDALRSTLPNLGKFDQAFEIVDFETAAALLAPHDAMLDDIEELVLGSAGQAAVLDSAEGTTRALTLMRIGVTGNALCARAVVAASEGRGADALRSLSAALDISHTIDHPSLSSLLLGVALDTPIAKTWQRIDRDFGHRLDLRDFERELGPRFERAGGHERVVVSMRGELVRMLSNIENDGVLIDMGGAESDLGLHIVQHYRATLENWYEDCTRVRPQTWRECDSSCIIDRRMSDVHDSLRGYQLTRLALAIRAHLARTGDWPAGLEELQLAGSPAVDPCLGTPFRYELGVDEVRLWAEAPPPGVTACGRHPGDVKGLLDWRWTR